MKFSNNPQSVYNGAISGQRNMFLSSSLAAMIIGFSSNFKSPHVIKFVKIIGICIFIISITTGYLSNNDFRFYLDKMKILGLLLEILGITQNHRLFKAIIITS